MNILLKNILLNINFILNLLINHCLNEFVHVHKQYELKISLSYHADF